MICSQSDAHQCRAYDLYMNNKEYSVQYLLHVRTLAPRALI